jgi:hypothetical protein
MIVSVDVYTQNVDAALAAFKIAIESGATCVRLLSNEDSDTNKFAYLNLMFEADHTSVAIAKLDEGPFVKNFNDLKSLRVELDQGLLRRSV